MVSTLSLQAVQAIIIISSDDCSRILTHYYGAPHPSTSSKANHSSGSERLGTARDQLTFEKGLFEKIKKAHGDIVLFDGKLVSYKSEGDVTFCVVSSEHESELLLYNVVLAVRDSLSIILKNSIDKRSLIENYDIVSLAIDEICDDGIILELDAVTIAGRISKAPPQDVQLKGVEFSEQGVRDLFELGKRSFKETIRQL